MNLIILVVILLVLFGGGGFYYGGPYVGGGLGTVLLIILIVLLLRRMTSAARSDGRHPRKSPWQTKLAETVRSPALGEPWGINWRGDGRRSSYPFGHWRTLRYQWGGDKRSIWR